MQCQGHDSNNISNLTAPGNRTRGPSRSCRIFVDMDDLATKPSSLDDGLVARLAISTLINAETKCHCSSEWTGALFLKG